MARHSQRHRSTTLPFNYRDEGLDFDLEDYSVDGRKPESMDLAAGEYTIDISPRTLSGPRDHSEPWDKVTLFGTLTLSRDVIEHVFPADERDVPPGHLYVAVRCHETIYRDKVTIEEPPVTAGEYPVRIKLHWEDFRGNVELRPYLVRTQNRTETEQFASSRNTKLASGDRYEVVVDRLDNDEPPEIDGEEASFTQNAHLPNGDKLYYLDFRNESRPKLWINSDNPRVADVLRSEGSVGAEPRLRDVILDQISYGVWSQLIVHAATAIDREGDVEYEWQQTVLEAFLPELYEVESVEEAKHLVWEDLREPDGVAQLVSRIDTEMQDFLEPREQLINLMEEGLQI